MEVTPDLVAEGPRQRNVLHHHDRAARPLHRQRRRDLAADVAAADQHDVVGALGGLADRVRVAERAQVVDALELGALGAQDVDVRARRDQGLGERDLVAALQLGRPRAGVERHHVLSAHELDVVLLVPLGRMHVGVLALRLAAQVLLRQRRALVRRLGLAPDEQHVPVGAALAQLGGAVRGAPCRPRSAGTRPRVRSPRPHPSFAFESAPSRSRRRRARRTASDPPRRPGSSTARTSSPASSTVSGPGTKPRPSRSTEISRLPSGRSRSPTRLAGDRRPLGQQHLDDLEPLLGQVEQVDQPVVGHLVLDQPQDQVGRRDVRPDAQQLEPLLVSRVVDARDDPVDEVLLLRDLADQHVVLVVAGHRDHHVGARDPGALEDPELRGVAVLDVVLELLLDGQVAVAVPSRSGSPRGPCRAARGPGSSPTLPAPTTITYIPSPIGAATLGVAGRCAAGRAADLGLEHVDRDPGRADRVQPLLLVPLGPQRVEDPRDDDRHVEPALRDLGDDDVRVVAVGRGDEGVGALDPGRLQRIDLEPRADRELTARVLPRALEADLETGVRLGVLVQARNLVAVARASPGPATTRRDPLRRRR